MVIGIIGENCSGTSTLAQARAKETGTAIVTGKDYLRMAKTESEAAALFRKRLENAVHGENIIYVISEQEHTAFLPDGAVRILVSADLDTIRERFKARMRGDLPAPVARMLERKHGMFDAGSYDFRFDGVHGDAGVLCEALKERIRSAAETGEAV